MAELVLKADAAGDLTINRHIYGHFAEHLGRCIYDGMWVGEDSDIPNIRGWRKDIVDALIEIRVPNIRWPGGCFAEEYHWRDGVGPREERPKYFDEPNTVGTAEFMDLCEILDTQAYLCGNLAGGTTQEIVDWLDYIRGAGDTPMANLRRSHGRNEPWDRVKFWCFGNESMECGGMMTAEYFAEHFRHIASNVGGVAKVACGPNHENYVWTEKVMRIAGDMMDGLAMHYYTIIGPWANKGDAVDFDAYEWGRTMAKVWYTEELVREHDYIMSRYDPDKRVGLVVDEWGTWFNRPDDASLCWQQNTLRDALVTGTTFNIFQNHCDRVSMANIAQLVNILQALILTEPGDGRMVLTPTYHVFNMYKVHHDATFIPTRLTSEDYTFETHDGGTARLPAINTSASRDADGTIHLSICNVDPDRAHTVSCALQGATVKTVCGTILTDDAMNAHNTYDDPTRLTPSEFSGATLDGDTLTIAMPAKSVVTLALT